jgi:serine/threonine-protein kinase
MQDVFGIVGSTLAGRIRVDEAIAEGGFGVVYRAEHITFRGAVAVKCLKIPGTITAEQSERFIENFREEAEILFHLSAHIPEVVRALDADGLVLDDGTFVPYIVMEWIEGRPLDSIIVVRERQGKPPLGLRRLVRMLAPVARALARAHDFRVPGGDAVCVAHCDIKPENIVITERDHPVPAKILDFGIAKARHRLQQQVGRITDRDAASPFTPAYGAPEQWLPKRFGLSGPWTDVWGMALTMVEALSGRPPIDGDMHAMMGAALDETRRPTPRNEGVVISDAVETVFRRALAVDPQRRYQDIESFWTELERVAGLPLTFERARRREAEEANARVSLEAGDSEPPAKAPDFDDGLDDAFEDSIDTGAPLASDEAPPSTGEGDEPSSAPASEDRDAPSGELELDLDRASQTPNGSDGRISLASDRAPRSVPPPRGVPLGSEAPSASAPRPRAAVVGGATPSSPGAAPVSRGGGIAAPARPVARELVRSHGGGDAGELKTLLRVPLLLVAFAVALTAVDMLLARQMGGTLELGPVKMRWIAVALGVLGVAIGFWNLVGDRDG